MKIRIDIDCTPDEARAFFGLPDPAPLHAAMMEKMREHMNAMDPAELMKMWMPAGMEGLQRMQEAFMSAFTGAGADRRDK